MFAIPPLPRTFRQALLARVYRALAAGHCGALVGVANVGKSCLAAYMSQPAVGAHYWGAAAAATLFLRVDGNDLLERSEWGLYEKILSALLGQLETQPATFDSACRTQIGAWYERLLQPAERPVARRYLLWALRELRRVGRRRVVLLLDDFDAFLSQADDLTLAGLRGLREMGPPDEPAPLVYVLFLRKPPTHWRGSPTPGAESFWELFKNFTEPVGCYDRLEAIGMVQRLAAAAPQVALTRERVLALCRVTGGHAGLLQAVFHSHTADHWEGADWAKVLLDATAVWNECARLCDNLPAPHQEALYQVMQNDDPGPKETRWLEQWGLMTRATPTPSVLPLLQAFMLALSPKEEEDDEEGDLPASAGPPPAGPPPAGPAPNPGGAIARLQLIPPGTLLLPSRSVSLTPREYRVAQVLGQTPGVWRTTAELARATAMPVNEVARVAHRVWNKIRRAQGRPPPVVMEFEGATGFRFL